MTMVGGEGQDTEPGTYMNIYIYIYNELYIMKYYIWYKKYIKYYINILYFCWKSLWIIRIAWPAGAANVPAA